MTGTGADVDAAALLRIAVDAASEAGRLLASWRGEARPEVIDTKSSPTDVVTEMDRRSEALITGRIREVRPGDTVLGEEGGQTAGEVPPAGNGAADHDGPAGSSRVRWVVDPLDGTVNYLYGLPDWAVSIAAEVDGTGVAGWWPRWMAPSTTCTACPTGPCPSRLRGMAPWSRAWWRCPASVRPSRLWPARAPGCTVTARPLRCAARRGWRWGRQAPRSG